MMSESLSCYCSTLREQGCKWFAGNNINLLRLWRARHSISPTASGFRQWRAQPSWTATDGAVHSDADLAAESTVLPMCIRMQVLFHQTTDSQKAS